MRMRIPTRLVRSDVGAGERALVGAGMAATGELTVMTLVAMNLAAVLGPVLLSLVHHVGAFGIVRRSATNVFLMDLVTVSHILVPS
jgi:hypothetical protein